MFGKNFGVGRISIHGASTGRQHQWASFSMAKKMQLRRTMKDSDEDGVPDYYDCRPHNPFRQDDEIAPASERMRAYNARRYAMTPELPAEERRYAQDIAREREEKEDAKWNAYAETRAHNVEQERRQWERQQEAKKSWWEKLW